ncbi:uncharacterized protein DUF3592 [Stackebrandtia albiflava]|uniref:Uncharacterized protein DUF3592 n=1 Tax=Stackebrandtia albiflava TaxID=406432 RepID=A0A562V0V8_9ACTN|nr:DUF3592 domain-containing protein [Stackebrandtia albiflava]TWJ11550.1 uncharacterized protein DUF3592 [Stackebrandtia albiflava]
MSFTLAQARVGAKTFPLPWAPRIRARHHAVFRRGVVVSALMWFPLGAGMGWVLTGSALAPGFALWPVMPWWFAPVMMLTPCVLAAFSSAEHLNPALIKSIGYARAGMNTVSGRHAKPPTPLAGITYGVAGLAFATGWPVGAGIALWQAADRIDAVPLALTGVATLLMPGLIGWTAFTRVRRFTAGMRDERRRQAIAAHVAAHGVRVAGEVTGVRFTRQWLNQQPVFALTVEYPGPDGTRDVKFHYPDYPRWAPVVGNRFDVWYDPAAPDDPERILLERRIVGQRFQTDVEHLRRPKAGGDGPDLGPVAPDWADDPKPPRSRTFLLYRGLIVSTVMATLLVITLIRWIAEFGPGYWWEIPVLAVIAALYTVNAVWWIALNGRAQWVTTVTWSTETLAWIGFMLTFAGMGVAGYRIVEAFMDFELDGFLFLCLGVMVAAGWSGVMLADGELRFTQIVAETRPTPHDEIHEALRSGDPDAVARLERDYGFRIGAQHTK